MQKNDKSYTFLLAHSSKSGIYIKRVAVRKSYLHFGTVGILLIFGISAVSIGMTGLVRNAVLADSAAPAAAALTQLPAPPAKTAEIPDYTRPASSNDLAFNSGGPEPDDEVDGENLELANQLRSIRARSNPENLPTMWAHLGKINNEFGFRRNPFGGRAYEFHAGMDIDGERGDPIFAPAAGTVVSAGYKGGYGNLVEIDHGNGLTTRYGHMSKIETETGAVLRRGEVIGQIGSTGRSTGPHLHYELRLNDRSINPRHFLPAEPLDLTKIVKK